MKLTILTRGKDVDEDMTADPNCVKFLKEQHDIHYVGLAVPGFTVVSACVLAGGFDVRERNDFMLRVNHGKETGTLYPQANITLLPSPTASYGGMDHNVHHQGEYSEEELIAQMLDAFQANSNYIKSPTMYFDFRNVGVNESHYLASLKATIDRADTKHLPAEVITWEARA